MTAHLSSAQIAGYLARTLPSGEILALHDHTATCEDCRQVLEEAAAAGPSLLGDGMDPHLTEDEMAAFAARRLTAPRRAEALRHLAACAICQDSVAAMQSVQANRDGVRWFSIAGGIAATLLIAALIHGWPGHPQVAPSEVPAILISLRDGSQTIALDSLGSLRGLEGASAKERSLVRDALQRRSLPAGPHLSAEAPGVLLAPGAGSRPPFSLISPIDTRVLSDRPVFTWQPYPGADSYQLIVTSQTFDPLARSNRIATTEWRPDTPLPRGLLLLWQVRAWHDDEMVSAPAPPAPPARFEIVGPGFADRLEQLRASPQPSHLLAAVLCSREGLRDEAAKELEILARENPETPLIRSLEGSSPGH